MGYSEEEARLLGYSTALLYAIGHEVHDPSEYDSSVEAKFPEGWHDRLAKAFDKYLAAADPEQLNRGGTLFELYRAWRDGCKVGFNRVDLEKLIGWLGIPRAGG